MKVSDMISKLEAMEPEAELRFFFIIPDILTDEVEKGQIFVEDISASQEGVEILLG